MIKNFYDRGKRLVYLNTAIHITDDTAMVVERCGRILEYSEIYVSLKANGLKVAIWGRDLKVDDFDTDCVRVRGTIQSVELSR